MNQWEFNSIKQATYIKHVDLFQSHIYTIKIFKLNQNPIKYSYIYANSQVIIAWLSKE